MTTHTKHLPEGFRIEQPDGSGYDDPWRLYSGDAALAVLRRSGTPEWNITHIYNDRLEFRSAVKTMLITFREGMKLDMAAWHLKCDLEMEQQHKAESDAAYAALFGGDERDVNR